MDRLDFVIIVIQQDRRSGIDPATQQKATVVTESVLFLPISVVQVEYYPVDSATSTKNIHTPTEFQFLVCICVISK